MTFSTVNRRQETYYLHEKRVELRNHHRQRIFFFAKTIREGALDSVPDGYEIVENAKTALPVLRRIKTHSDAAG